MDGVMAGTGERQRDQNTAQDVGPRVRIRPLNSPDVRSVPPRLNVVVVCFHESAQDWEEVVLETTDSHEAERVRELLKRGKLDARVERY